MNKTEKKAKREAWKKAEREAARENFPLPAEKLRALFDAVDVGLADAPCDHSRRIVEAWLSERKLPAKPVLHWLDGLGGFCDCEVLANVEQAFEEALKP